MMPENGGKISLRRILIRVPNRLAKFAVIIGIATSLQSIPVAADNVPASAGASANLKGPHKFTNKLIESNDPYLLLHAHNPVDWHPWGPEAFAKAKKENKPIFISVGYSTCYWCHVAERTIYSDPEIAKLMNQWFINVKVDSEQRPDVDRIYMIARQLMTGHGGWPNNIFLTPDLKPFYAGSYFPPKDDPRAGPGFPTVLAAIDRAWTSNRAQALTVADNVMTAMRRVQSQMTGGTVAPIKPAAWLAKARDKLLSQLDTQHGGFGDRRSGTKFPNPPRLALLLTDYQINGTAAGLPGVLKALDAIFHGGIHDHLAGGFHRYSTEPTWSIPHFEKMLYDNAQLLRLYAEAFRLTKDPLYRQIAIETARYIGQDMMSPDGGFFTARDAQVDGAEGEGYLWTAGEIAALLGEKEAKRFLALYALTELPRPNVPDIVHPRDVNGEAPAVLRLRVPAEQTPRIAGIGTASKLYSDFAADRATLLAARGKRVQPARDEKIVTALNGLAIAALAESGQIVGEPQFVSWARQAAERIWTLAFDARTGSLKNEIYRGKAQTEGFLSNYATLGVAFVSLADVTGEAKWRERAATLANSILDRFARADGSFATTPHEKDLLIPIGDEGDTEVPSGTSMAINLLLRLGALSDGARYREAAVRAVHRLSGQFQDRPEAWAFAIATLNRYPLPAIPATAATTPAATGAAGAYRIPETADHVHVAASGKTDSTGDEIIVTIKVDEKFHINANPASLDFLIPTSVEFTGVKPTKIEYPKPARFVAKFAPEGLDVYDRSVAVVARFPKGTLGTVNPVQGTVTAQACTDQICLPPSKLPLSLSSIGR